MSTSGPSPPGPAWSSAARSRRTLVMESFLQLFQRDPASDQLIQRQLATQIMADQNRDVAVQVRRPEIAALDRLLADERPGAERDPGTAGQQPDKHQLPAHIQARPRLLHRLLPAQSLEGLISATDNGSSHLHEPTPTPAHSGPGGVLQRACNCGRPC